MNNMFYPKMAGMNIKKNGKFYFPFLLTFMGTTAMFYIMYAIACNHGMNEMPGANSLVQILCLGTIVIGVFAIIFLFYTNSFLMKRREKEFGLYNILGMEKKHISRILFFETFFICLIGIVFGLIFGVVLNKLMLLILGNIIDIGVPFRFEVLPKVMLTTIALFVAISLLLFLWNIVKIKMSKPIELLKGGNVGEKEPKSKWILALLGIVSLGAAYYISITTKNPLSAFMLFFVAVLLVIVGTYALFTAGSIVILKLLRKNKKFYYHPKHFTSISGMIYRMKQNAIGLANVCILSTMVLVMVSTTASLYVGADDALKERYPKDVGISVNYEYGKNDYADEITKLVTKTAKEKHRNLSKVRKYRELEFSGALKNGTFVFDVNENFTVTGMHTLVFITQDQYEALGGKATTLAKDEVLMWNSRVRLGEKLQILSSTFHVKKTLKDFPINSELGSGVADVDCFVVSDESVMKRLYEDQKKQYKEYASSMSYHQEFNMDGSDEEKIIFSKKLNKEVGAFVERGMNGHVENRQSEKADFYKTFGGFLFLGVFLGLLFLMATSLIIYYKQISEGYDDKQRFEIMQKVGMSSGEVKKTIGSQVVMVFFLPIAMAGIHVAAAFPMIKRLLALFSLTNTKLFGVCTIGTMAVFAVVYSLVYLLTAKIYYRIVKWNKA